MPFLARKVLLMNKTILKYGLITSLLVNFTIGGRYLVDTKEYQKQINIQNKIIEQNKSKQRLLEEYSLKNTEKIDDLYIKNSLLTEELNKVKLENSQLKSENGKLKMENEKLKKDYESRKEAKKTVFIVTAYTAGYESTQKRKGDKGYGLTASGTIVTEGRTIACPPSLQFGSKLNIEGVGLRVCEDRGQAIKEGRLDLYISNVNAALSFGKKKLIVEIIN
jgi:3D (Asp-Asp-Asp) domain-containing protein